MRSAPGGAVACAARCRHPASVHRCRRRRRPRPAIGAGRVGDGDRVAHGSLC